MSLFKFLTFLTVVALFLAFGFYWFKIQPSRAVSDCSNLAIVNTKGASDSDEQTIDLAYKICLKNKGL